MTDDKRKALEEASRPPREHDDLGDALWDDGLTEPGTDQPEEIPATNLDPLQVDQ